MKPSLSLFTILFSFTCWASRGGEGPLPVPALISELILEQKWHPNKEPVSEVLWFSNCGSVASFAGKNLGSPKGLFQPAKGVAPVEREDKVFLYDGGMFLDLPDWVRPLKVSTRTDEEFRGIKELSNQFLTYDFFIEGPEIHIAERCRTPVEKSMRMVSSGDGKNYFYVENSGVIYELTSRCEWKRVYSIPISFKLKVDSISYFRSGVVIEHSKKQLWSSASMSYVIPEVTGPAYVIDETLPAWVSNTDDGGIALVLPSSRRVVRIFDRGHIQSQQQVAYSQKDDTLYFAGQIHPQSPYGIHSIKLDLESLRRD